MVGFDTCHFGDWPVYVYAQPVTRHLSRMMGGVYRDYQWTMAECQQLARQVYIRCIVSRRCIRKWREVVSSAAKQRREARAIYDCCVHHLNMRARDLSRTTPRTPPALSPDYPGLPRLTPDYPV